MVSPDFAFFFSLKQQYMKKWKSQISVKYTEREREREREKGVGERERNRDGEK